MDTTKLRPRAEEEERSRKYCQLLHLKARV
jgi:hypothetical protein